MTRILATSDLHLRSDSMHRHDILADTEAVLDQIIDTAREHDCDLLLLAGDVFHKPKPDPATLHLFDRFARNLSDAGLPCVAILGDVAHDQQDTDAPTALELFASDWMRVVRYPEMIQAAGDVAVCAMPATSTARLRAVLADRGQLEYTNELAAALLVDIAAELRAQVPDGWPSVMLLHHHISGAALPNGLPVENLGKPVMPVDALAELDFDVVIAGDIHRPQELACGGMYCGSPMTLDFGEGGFEHGVWVVEFEAAGELVEA